MTCYNEEEGGKNESYKLQISNSTNTSRVISLVIFKRKDAHEKFFFYSIRNENRLDSLV
jgi:hypothetical protein